MTIAHFANRGHSLRELAGLTSVELAFLRAAWVIEMERMTPPPPDGGSPPLSGTAREWR